MQKARNLWLQMLWLFAEIGNDAFFFLNCFTRRDDGMVGQGGNNPGPQILPELKAKVTSVSNKVC